MRFVLLLAALLLVVLTSEARAGTLSLEPHPYAGSITAYIAGAGERNDVSLRGQYTAGEGTAPGTSLLFVHDASAPVRAVAPCEVVDEHTARCPGGSPVPGGGSLVVAVGDGDDVVRLPGAGSGGGRLPDVVLGGEGNDVLSGAATLIGGAGNDVLTGADSPPCDKYMPYCSERLVGGPGDDVLNALGGDDTLIGDGDDRGNDDRGGGNDVLDGGAGEDRLYFPGRTTGVRVDLAAGVSRGAAGETDRLWGLEIVYGGDGPDLLRGSHAPDELYGGLGADVVEGGGGNDELHDTSPSTVGGPRPHDRDRDTLRGGSGDDRIDSEGGGDRLDGGSGNDSLHAFRPASIRCGTGYDRAWSPRPAPLSGCERFVGFLDVTVSATGARRVRVVVRCSRSFTFVRCDLRVSVRLPATRRAVRRLSMSHRRPQRELMLRGDRRLRRNDPITLAFSGTVDNGAAGVERIDERWRVRL